MIGSLNNAWRDAPTIVIMAWCCGVLIKYLGWVLGGSCIGQASVASAVRFTCGVRTAVPYLSVPDGRIGRCHRDDREWGAIPESELSGHLGKPESTWLVVHKRRRIHRDGSETDRTNHSATRQGDVARHPERSKGETEAPASETLMPLKGGKGLTQGEKGPAKSVMAPFSPPRNQ